MYLKLWGASTIKKFTISFLFTLLFVFSINNKVFGAYYTAKDNSKGVVLNVIDGDSISVKLDSDNSVIFIKLLGVDSMGFDKSFEFLNNELLGERVFITFDYAVLTSYNRWHNAYVYYGKSLINTKILEKGYGKVNTNQKKIAMFNSFLLSENFARSNKLGIWSDENKNNFDINKYHYININLASYEQLKDYLIDVDYDLLNRIITYRGLYNFSRIEETRNIIGFTESIFIKNMYFMKTTTNISTAPLEELLTMSIITIEEAEKIIAYREEIGFLNTDELYKNNIISNFKYNKIKNFIVLED